MLTAISNLLKYIVEFKGKRKKIRITAGQWSFSAVDTLEISADASLLHFYDWLSLVQQVTLGLKLVPSKPMEEGAKQSTSCKINHFSIFSTLFAK